MKKLILVIFIISGSIAGKIDNALYEGGDISSYFQKIEKRIDSNISKKLKSKETISLEKSTLSKLKQLYAIKDDVNSFETITLSGKHIKETRYLKAFYLLSKLKIEIQRLKLKEKSIQTKLFELKNHIKKTLKDDANNSLLHSQLQYAFYKISQEKITHSLSTYQQLFKQEFLLFQQALTKVDFKEQLSKNIIKATDKKIDAIKNKNLLLNIDKDSEALRDTKAQKQIVNKEKSILKETDFALSKKTKAHILLALKWIKEKNQTQFLVTTKEMKEDFKTLSQEQKKKFTVFLSLLTSIADNNFNDTDIALASTKLNLDSMKENVTSLINKTLFVYEEKAFSAKTILTFLLIIMIGLITSKLYKNIIGRYRKKNRIKSLSTARLIANSGYYLIILTTFFVALIAIGLSIQMIFLVIGAILLWIALGLQGFISNYAMGILIKIDRSIRIGDLIELDNISGTVDDMDFRSITLQTNDQVRLIIPNSRFISGTFINHSLEEDIRRIHIPFSADKSISHEDIQKRILKDLDESNLSHIKTLDKKSQVIISAINRKITRYTLLVWINKQDYHDSILMKSLFLNIIQKSLSHLQNYATISTINTKEKNYD